MVDDQFLENVRGSILVRDRKMSGVVNGDLEISSHGHDEDQSQGYFHGERTSMLPFSSVLYTPEEYLVVRIPVRNKHFRWIHQVIPVLNYQGRYIPGFSTFVTWVPYPSADTYVQRKLIMSNKLVPYDLHVRQKIKAPQIIRQKMITSAAVNSMNEYSTLCWKLCGSMSREHYSGSKKFKVDVDIRKYPPGAFTIVPYHGHSILIAREAGGIGGYAYSDRFRAFAWVAKRLAEFPEKGIDVGMFHVDRSLELVLPPILKHIDSRMSAKVARQSVGEEPGGTGRKVRKVRQVRKVRTPN